MNEMMDKMLTDPFFRGKDNVLLSNYIKNPRFSSLLFYLWVIGGQVERIHGVKNDTNFCAMKTKQDIVGDWLPRDTGMALKEFGTYVLLANVANYVRKFAEWNGGSEHVAAESMAVAT